jgi:putative SOS response-associated peptidase YedK
MCGRFTLRAPVSRVAEQFALLDAAPFEPRYNIAPTQPVAVVRQSLPSPASGERRQSLPSPVLGEGSGVRAVSPREFVWFRWGLVPSWAKDPAIGSRLINARAETAAEKPAFRAAMRRRRCLVVADGFYEWQRLAKGKQPYFIHMRDDRPFGFAGLWESWEGADHSALETCTILTTDANDLMRPIHDRMPVIISPADYACWLDPTNEKPDDLLPLLQPYRGGTLVAYPVSTLVNSPTHDDPRCIESASGR